MNDAMNRCLRHVYEQFDVPADAIVTDPELREAFASEVRKRADDPARETDHVLRDLLRLRKAGGLPRLRLTR
jgi:hypothetical protein